MSNLLFIIIISILIIGLIVSTFLMYDAKKRLCKIERDIEDNPLIEENKELKDSLSQLEKEFEELKEHTSYLYCLYEDIKKHIPTFMRGESLETNVENLKYFWLSSYGTDGEFFFEENSTKIPESLPGEEFFRDVKRKIKGADYISLLQENVTAPFIKEMEDRKDISDEECREMFIKMSTKLFDAISSFQSPYRKKGQELNISIIKNEITEEQAYAKAQEISDIEIECPLFIRNFSKSIKGIGLEDKQIIISGYKLKK